MKNPLIAALFASLVAVAACEPNTPEQRLQAAGDELDDTQLDLESLDQRIEQQQDVLALLKKQRRQTKNQLLTLEQRVAARATDVAVFRAVQSELLAEPKIRNAAITVDAESGNVTLSGLVSSRAEMEVALSIARGTAGVEHVKNRIEVETPGNDTDGS